MPDYVPQETGTICLFRITPHEGVDPVEAAAAVASPAPPPGRWYRPTPPLTASDSYRAKAFRVEPVPGIPGQFFAWVPAHRPGGRAQAPRQVRRRRDPASSGAVPLATRRASRPALDTWGEISFNYPSTDTSDFPVTPHTSS